MRPFLIVLLALTPFAANAQQPTVFRGGVSYVHVDVQVEERHRIVTGLKKDDFQITDENVTPQIAQFSEESEPLSLILLLDISGSMRPYLEQISSVAQEALAHLHPGDRVAVMLFSMRTAEHQEFTDNHAVAARMVNPKLYEDLDLGAGTAINQAVFDAARYMEKAQPGVDPVKQGRRAILILTDNMGLNYRVPDSQVLKALDDADTVLDALVVGKGRRPPPRVPGRYRNPDFTPSDVFKLADETGGETETAERADAVFPRMLERIRGRYAILYHEPQTALKGTFRRITVDLTPAARVLHPKAVLRYRAGYYAE